MSAAKCETGWGDLSTRAPFGRRDCHPTPPLISFASTQERASVSAPRSGYRTQKFNALNGGPKFKFNEAISFFISVDTQEQVDYFWSKLTADGGEESMCGWLKDKFGLSWQVIPTALGRYLSDPDRTRADRAMQAMMKMRKIVIADLDKAFAG